MEFIMVFNRYLMPFLRNHFHINNTFHRYFLIAFRPHNAQYTVEITFHAKLANLVPISIGIECTVKKTVMTSILEKK